MSPWEEKIQDQSTQRAWAQPKTGRTSQPKREIACMRWPYAQHLQRGGVGVQSNPTTDYRRIWPLASTIAHSDLAAVFIWLNASAYCATTHRLADLDAGAEERPHSSLAHGAMPRSDCFGRRRRAYTARPFARKVWAT